MEFVKVEGLSNDFIVIDGPYVPDPDDVVRWCARRTGVGADGVLVISRIDDGLMSMRYWNADGAFGVSRSSVTTGAGCHHARSS